MERIPKRKYTKEFREEAVKLVTKGELSIRSKQEAVFTAINPGELSKGVQRDRAPKAKSPNECSNGLFKINFGSDLLSHRVAPAVPSALEDLTAVFGMGTGVPPPV